VNRQTETQLICRVAEIQKQLYDLAAIVAKQQILALKQNYFTGAVVSGGMVVMIDTDRKVYPFDITNPYHFDKYLGVALQAGIPNTQISVITQGPGTFPGVGWLPGMPYYIGSTSFLTSVPPTLGVLKQVSVGIDTNTIIVVPTVGAVLI
jgi:hypothetical protein